MTRVRISIQSEVLGDVEVEQNDPVFSWNSDKQRASIARLLAEANAQIGRAYDLEAPRD